jgi:2-polyprenyl-6-methoxyphenol hydroxylase-like FAD-dependent oxidoreductase
MFDAIVVGARCAGSATALLLARMGYRVLLVDKTAFPSDTISTHYIHQPGVARLARWGVLDRLAASGCPPVRRQVFDVGPFALLGAPPPYDGIADAYAPRRTVLDAILLDAAIASGVEFREHLPVSDLLWDGDRVVGIRGTARGGRRVEERAQVVIGADGMRSRVARLVGAPTYAERPATSFAYYTYWSDVAVGTAELYPRPNRMLIAAPTHDQLTMTILYWPEDEFDLVRGDMERQFLAELDLVPELAERVRAGVREEPYRGMSGLAAFFRRPHGPGWALVGDAGYHKSPITALGISDAFRDAELLAAALDDAFSGRRTEQEALSGYEQARNEAAMPLYEMTADLARLEPPPPEMAALMAALQGDEEESGRFLGTIAGTVPIADFYAPENLARILSRTGETADQHVV